MGVSSNLPWTSPEKSGMVRTETLCSYKDMEIFMKYIPFAGKIFLTLLLNVLAVLAADRLVRTAHRHE